MVNILKYFFGTLKFYLRWLVDFFLGLGIRRKSSDNFRGVLLIRLDAIGDYVLFRNFLEVLRTSPDYADQQLTLIGNEAWRELAELLDQAWVDRFIWINRKKFGRNLLYRRRKLQEICAQDYACVIQPTLSREFFYGDTLVRFASAQEKIGSQGDCSNIAPWQKRIADKFYTRLIPAQNDVLFEFDRNREFFSFLLNVDLQVIRPEIKTDVFGDRERQGIPEKYAVLFIGASADYRKWHAQGFAQIAEFLYRNYRLSLVLSGGPSDFALRDAFTAQCTVPFIDRVGKTSLADLLPLLAGSCFLLSNETSIPHLAVALGVKNIFVVSNGNHFGRFVPYPKKITKNYHVIFHPKIHENVDNKSYLESILGQSSELDINQISVDMVKEKIKAEARFS